MDASEFTDEQVEALQALADGYNDQSVSRRDVMKLVGAGGVGALLGGGGAASAVDRASAGTAQSGQLGAVGDPLDLVTEDVMDPSGNVVASANAGVLEGTSLQYESVTADELPNINTRLVSTSQDLQTAIDDATAGDRLIVAPGHSYSKTITINKALSVQWPYFGDHQDPNITFDSLGSTDDCFHITADQVLMNNPFVHVTDGSGRHAYNISAGDFMAGKLGFENPGGRGVHLDQKVRFRFEGILGWKADAEGLYVPNTNPASRLYGEWIYLVGNGGPDGVPSTHIESSAEGNIGYIISSGGGSAYGGDAYEGVKFGVNVQDLTIGGLHIEDITSTGLTTASSVASSGPRRIEIGTIFAYDVGLDGSSSVIRLNALHDSHIGRIKESNSSVTPPDGLYMANCPGTQIGSLDLADGRNYEYLDERAPLVIQDIGKYIPGATASDLETRQIALDPTNGRIVWKDSGNNAYYVDGTAL